MKASEAVEQLKKIIEEEGDLDIYWEYSYDLSEIEVQFNDGQPAFITLY